MGYKNRKSILIDLHSVVKMDTDSINFYKKNRLPYKEIFDTLEHKEIKGMNNIDERCVDLLIELYEEGNDIVKSFNSQSHKDILKLGEKILELELDKDTKEYLIDKIKYNVAVEVESNLNKVKDKYMKFILEVRDTNIDLNDNDTNVLVKSANKKLEDNFDRSLEFFKDALENRRQLINEGEMNDNNEPFTIEEIIEITDNGYYECLN